MTIEEIKQELITLGKNPDDYKIDIFGDGYSISPKWYTQYKEIAKKEDVPIIQDINDVAGTVAYNLIDVNDLAETLALALIKIDNLKTEIELIKGGKK